MQFALRLWLLTPLVAALAALPHRCGAQRLYEDPDRAPIVTTDIAAFWAVYDATDGQPRAADLRGGYLQPGSQGVRDFTPNRIESAKKLARTVNSHRDYYEAVRPYTERIVATVPEIRAAYRRFKTLYPAVRYPAAYFVIGRMNSGGTTGPESLIMGAEMFGDTAATPPARIAFASIPLLVVHELMHYQQTFTGPPDLLYQVIKEGSADFLAAVVLERELDQHYLDDFARPREAELWALFQDQMDRTSYDGWLYGGTTRLFPDAPNDLGYWLGFQITAAYYARAADKRAAIAEILNIRDFPAFLRASGYAGARE